MLSLSGEFREDSRTNEPVRQRPQKSTETVHIAVMHHSVWGNQAGRCAETKSTKIPGAALNVLPTQCTHPRETFGFVCDPQSKHFFPDNTVHT